MRVRLKAAASLVPAIALAIVSGSGSAGAAAPPFPLATCSAPGVISPVPSPSTSTAAANLRAAAQVTHFDRGNVTVSTNFAVDGAIEVEARAHDLVVRKTVQAAGRSRLEFESAGDTVIVDVSESAIVVTRAGESISLGPESGEQDFARVRRLLADSASARAMRRVGAEFEASEDDSPSAIPLVIADAMVGTLTGDIGASRRAAKQLSRKAASKFRKVQRPVTCYYQWEQAVMWSYMEYEDCNVFMYMPGLWCSLRWHLQVESAWFGFIRCTGLGF